MPQRGTTLPAAYSRSASTPLVLCRPPRLTLLITWVRLDGGARTEAGLQRPDTRQLSAAARSNQTGFITETQKFTSFTYAAFQQLLVVELGLEPV